MSGFDTTAVASTVGQGVNLFNPIATLGQIAQLQNATNANRFFQARQAAGAAAQAAIDPTTGAYDPRAANQYLANTPGAAMAAPEALAANQTYSTNAQTLAAAKYGAVRSQLGPLMTAPNLTTNDVALSLSQLRDAGVIDPDTAATIAGSMPADPIKLRTYLANQFGLPNLGPQAALDATAPKPVGTNVGGAIDQIAPPPQIGPSTLSGPPAADGVSTVGAPGQGPTVEGGTPITLTPSDNTNTRTIVQNGRPISVPFASLYNPDGTPKPNAFTGPHGEAQAQYTPTEQATGTAVGAGLGGTAADQVHDLLTTAAGSAQRKTLLTEMRDIIAAGDFRTGPNAAKWADLVTNANSTFGTHFDTAGSAGEQVFSKIAEQFAAAQQKVAGRAATDAQTSATRLANPNTQFSPEANNQVIGQLLGNEDLVQHEVKAYNYWLGKGGSPQDVGTKFIPSYTSRFNPLFFQEKYMTPLQKKTVIGGMSPADAQAYQAARAKYMGMDLGQ